MVALSSKFKVVRAIWFRPVIVFASIAALLLWHAFWPGEQLFLLDMPWPQSFQLADYIYVFDANGARMLVLQPGMPWNLMMALLSELLGPPLVQLLLLGGVLAAIGINMWALAYVVYHRTVSSATAKLLAYVAGVVYMLNPYVLDRLLSGQWRVLAGYALVPLIIRLYMTWLSHYYFNSRPQPLRSHSRLSGAQVVPAATARTTRHEAGSAQASGTQSVLGVGIVYALLPTLSLHWWFIVTVCAAPIFLRQWWVHKHAFTPAAVRLGAIWVVVNPWWVVYALVVRSPLYGLQVADTYLFGAVATMPLGVVASILSGGGFWYHPFYFVGGADWVWLGLVGVWIVLSVVAVVWSFRHAKALISYAVGIWLVAVIVCIASGNDATAQFLSRILDAFPGAVGLREITKLVGIIMFGYALAVPFGMYLILKKWNRLWLRTAAYGMIGIILLCIMTPVIIEPTRTYPYPSGWGQADEYMRAAGARKVLVLPYVGYMRMSFVDDQLIANPARAYFSAPVITGVSTGNPLFDDARTQTPGTISELLNRMYDGKPISSQLRTLGVDYILIISRILPVPSDSSLRAAGLERVVDNDDCSLYRVR